MNRRRCYWLEIDGVAVRVQTQRGVMSDKDRAALIDAVRCLQVAARKKLAGGADADAART